MGSRAHKTEDMNAAIWILTGLLFARYYSFNTLTFCSAALDCMKAAQFRTKGGNLEVVQVPIPNPCKIHYFHDRNSVAAGQVRIKVKNLWNMPLWYLMDLL